MQYNMTSVTGAPHSGACGCGTSDGGGQQSRKDGNVNRTSKKTCDDDLALPQFSTDCGSNGTDTTRVGVSSVPTGPPPTPIKNQEAFFRRSSQKRPTILISKWRAMPH